MTTRPSQTRPGRLESVSRVLTLLVTNVTKLLGLYIGFKAAPTGNAVVLAYSALLIGGGQLSESLVLGAIERFFGLHQERERR